MILINDIAYIGYEEEWKKIDYKNIKKHTYLISNLGRIKKIKNNKILSGNNPINENGGYCRISLKTDTGEQKRFPIHRLVLFHFGNLSDEKEVNHKNGSKLENDVFNLEENTRLENAHHAAENDLYQNCENHYKSTFTNDQVHCICRMLEEGTPVSDIIRFLGFENRENIYSNIDKIISKKSWKKISSQYNIDRNKFHYKTYSYDDLCLICKMIFIENKSNKSIIESFPQYDSSKLKITLKGIRGKRVYKSIIEKFERSTTIESIL